MSGVLVGIHHYVDEDEDDAPIVSAMEVWIGSHNPPVRIVTTTVPSDDDR